MGKALMGDIFDWWDTVQHDFVPKALWLTRRAAETCLREAVCLNRLELWEFKHGASA
jgi:hypothetical protein